MIIHVSSELIDCPMSISDEMAEERVNLNRGEKTDWPVQMRIAITHIPHAS